MAQQFSLYHYYASDLEHTPQVIKMSPGYLTVIEFWGPVDLVSSGRSDLLNVDVQGSKVLISPLMNSGLTDLIIDVGGRTMMFKLNVENGITPRRYVVKREAPAPRVDVTGSATNAVPGITNWIPETGDPQIRFIAWAERAPTGEMTIHYTIANLTANPLAAEASRIQILNELQSLKFRAIRGSTGTMIDRLDPGTQQSGTLFLDEGANDKIKLVWPVVEIGPAITHTIEIEIGKDARKKNIEIHTEPQVKPQEPVNEKQPTITP
jgi:hypothetical protein